MEATSRSSHFGIFNKKHEASENCYEDISLAVSKHVLFIVPTAHDLNFYLREISHKEIGSWSSMGFRSKNEETQRNVIRDFKIVRDSSLSYN